MPTLKEWYKVVIANDIKQLQDEVNRLMAKNMGWKPSGGVQLVQNFGVFYTQAMVRVFKPGGTGRPKGVKNKPKPAVVVPDDNPLKMVYTQEEEEG